MFNGDFHVMSQIRGYFSENSVRTCLTGEATVNAAVKVRAHNLVPDVGHVL